MLYARDVVLLNCGNNQMTEQMPIIKGKTTLTMAKGTNKAIIKELTDRLLLV
jgi:hypothetical protein